MNAFNFIEPEPELPPPPWHGTDEERDKWYQGFVKRISERCGVTYKEKNKPSNP